ncbi:MAG: hypothetical protein LBR38_01695 [Synergistaceae bacterium]|jgi:hypothetical protein|nr:hypothetical protein [Synergistaceae bacterium]
MMEAVSVLEPAARLAPPSERRVTSRRDAMKMAMKSKEAFAASGGTPSTDPEALVALVREGHR